MNKTKIEWCDVTLNPVVGCRYNCAYCYARKLNNRFKFIDQWNEPQLFAERLEQLNTKKPKTIFMNSMSDVADWNSEMQNAVGPSMNKYPQHNYLYLTKRPKDANFYKAFTSPNEWAGVTVQSMFNRHKIAALINQKAKNSNCKLFISFEPLLDDVLDFFLAFEEEPFNYINWFIIGAETGNREDKVIPKSSWIKNICDLAKRNNIPVFMKESLVPVIGENNMLREFPEELKRGTS
jgi:protein gp37